MKGIASTSPLGNKSNDNDPLDFEDETKNNQLFVNASDTDELSAIIDDYDSAITDL